MNDGLIPRRYATALYKYAVEKGTDKELYALMSALVSSYAATPELGKALANPYLSVDSKRTLILSACGLKPNESNALIDAFVRLLDDNHRMNMAGDIAQAYCDIYRKANNIYKVTVTSASPLDKASEERLKQIITSQLNGGKMEYTSSINPDLIGGFTVNIDNNRLDASVANELKQLRLKLLSK